MAFHPVGGTFRCLRLDNESRHHGDEPTIIGVKSHGLHSST
jgi:hypothetical protein